MIEQLFRSAGLSHYKSPQYDYLRRSYALAKYESFTAKMVANRDNAAWKTAEFIGVEGNLDVDAARALVEIWRGLDWRGQYLLLTEDGVQRLYDASANPVCAGEDAIVAFIQNRSEPRGLSRPSRPVHGVRELGDAAENPLLLRLLAALRTKPFAILAGHSGTGKSRMVRKLAYMTCRDAELLKGDVPGNFRMIQVKPNWHDSADLLGYHSALERKYRTTDFVTFICRAYAYPDVPFFVCLDEMNLAPVEQYFAECLSAMETARETDGVLVTDPILPGDVPVADLGLERAESRAWVERHGVTLPRNLFVVGTVNMDDTTCSFSRKVLDRAMTVEMNEIRFEDFGRKDAEPSADDLLADKWIDLLVTRKTRAETLTPRQVELLNRLKDALDETPFVVAYRFANEYALYTEALAAFGGGDAETAFDHLVLMKVLPRIIGERPMVEGLFTGDARAATAAKKGGLLGLFPEDGAPQKPAALSRGKMLKILGRASDEYLSFWP